MINFRRSCLYFFFRLTPSLDVAGIKFVCAWKQKYLKLSKYFAKLQTLIRKRSIFVVVTIKDFIIFFVSTSASKNSSQDYKCSDLKKKTLYKIMFFTNIVCKELVYNKVWYMCLSLSFILPKISLCFTLSLRKQMLRVFFLV